MLINCPKCNEKISNNAIKCPHCGLSFNESIICPECMTFVNPKEDMCHKCGYPMEKILANMNTKAQEPLSEEWLNKYTDKPVIVRIVMSLIFLVFLSTFLTFVIRAAHTNIFGSTGGAQFALITFLGGLSLMSLLLMLSSFINVKTIVKKVDNYNIVVYAGIFGIHLIIEDNEVSKAHHNKINVCDLSGILPNGKNIIVRYTSGAITITQHEVI